MLDKLLSAGWYVMTNGTLFFVFFSFNTTCFAKAMVNARIVVAPLFQMIFQFPKPFFVVCYETSRNNISFLDTYTTCKNGIMSTDIYNKLTDKHQYLSPQSCHPKHCTKSIPYSQALRIKRICSNEQTTKNGLEN
jgi:hypothetical protein